MEIRDTCLSLLSTSTNLSLYMSVWFRAAQIRVNQATNPSACLLFDNRPWKPAISSYRSRSEFCHVPLEHERTWRGRRMDVLVEINGDTRADDGKPQYEGPKVLHWWWSNSQWVLIEMSLQRSWPGRPERRAVGRQHPTWRKMRVATCHVAFVAGRETTPKSAWSSLLHQPWRESLRHTLPAAVVTTGTFTLPKLRSFVFIWKTQLVIFRLWSAVQS